MSYAIRNDGTGWRAVGGPDECGPDETWQEAQPSLPEPSSPRIGEIDNELAAIDAKGARPSREITAALAAGSQPPAAAVQKLADLEARAATLRTERKTLTKDDRAA